MADEEFPKSCAALMLDCIESLGSHDRETAFETLKANAKQLGLLPGERRVITATLNRLGYVRQNSKLSGKDIPMIFQMLNGCERPVSILIAVSSYQNYGGYMLAYKWAPVQNAPILCSESSLPGHLIRSKATDIWLRWNDGIDRSPFILRKAASHRIPVQEGFTTLPETDTYRYFNPNPCKRRTKDCVVRALAGVLTLSWEQALDLLMKEGITVNSPEVYERALQKLGFRRQAPVSAGEQLSAKDFCSLLNAEGQENCIFAAVGRNHVAAILPVKDVNGKFTYKLHDSWDSSEKAIGEYWIKPIEHKNA